jgi:hypothetical protein
LVDALARQPLPAHEVIPSELLVDEEAALQAIQAAAARVTTGQDTLAARREIERQNRALNQIWEQIVAHSPEYVTLRRGEPLPWNELRACLEMEA